MNKLKEHKAFRNQLIVLTILLLGFGLGFGIGEVIGFGIVMALIAAFNVFSYRENLRDYKNLYGDEYEGIQDLWWFYFSRR